MKWGYIVIAIASGLERDTHILLDDETREVEALEELKKWKLKVYTTHCCSIKVHSQRHALQQQLRSLFPAQTTDSAGAGTGSGAGAGAGTDPATVRSASPTTTTGLFALAPAPAPADTVLATQRKPKACAIL